MDGVRGWIHRLSSVREIHVLNGLHRNTVWPGEPDRHGVPEGSIEAVTIIGVDRAAVIGKGKEVEKPLHGAVIDGPVHDLFNPLACAGDQACNVSVVRRETSVEDELLLGEGQQYRLNSGLRSVFVAERHGIPRRREETASMRGQPARSAYRLPGGAGGGVHLNSVAPCR